MEDKIENINIALTNRCNLKCGYCTIWKEKKKNDLPLSAVKSILKSGALAGNVRIAFTGGEVFLYRYRSQLLKFICAQTPDSLKTISTNGILLSRIMNFLRLNFNCLPRDFSLHISLDGLMDSQRHTESLLNIMRDNIKHIRAYYPDLKIKLKFTITPFNFKQIIATYDYAVSNGLGFKVKLAEDALNYTNKMAVNKFHYDKKMRESIIRSLSFIYMREKADCSKEADFIKDTIFFLSEKTRMSSCRAPFNRVFVMSDGSVYSCIHFEPIGNINDASLQEIWNSPAAKRLRDRFRRSPCKKCVSYHGFDLY